MTDNSLIFISTGNNSSNEVRIVPANAPDAALVVGMSRGGMTSMKLACRPAIMRH